MTCRTCKFLSVSPDEKGRIIVRKGNTYRCNAPGPEMPELPASMTSRYDFRWPPSRGAMSPEDASTVRPTSPARRRHANQSLRPKWQPGCQPFDRMLETGLPVMEAMK